MLQKGTIPWVASPAENVTACCSAIPTSNARLGMAFIMMFIDEPEGMAGVMPMLRLFFSASYTSVCPITARYLGAVGLSLLDFLISTVILSNRPGACHVVWSFSASA